MPVVCLNESVLGTLVYMCVHTVHVDMRICTNVGMYQLIYVRVHKCKCMHDSGRGLVCDSMHKPLCIPLYMCLCFSVFLLVCVCM